MKLPGILLVTTSCSLLILIDSYINVAETAPLLYGVLCGGIGSYFYVFWYSNLERPKAIGIEVGEKIPDLKLVRYDRKKLTTENFVGRPAMYLFYRGNWCSLCLSQLTEISEEFHEFYDRGISIICISPQPEEETQKLAVTNPHQMNFMVDSSCEIAKQLGICHERGLPMGLEVMGYDSDTVYPTIIITDSKGIIVYTHQTNNHRVRPTIDELIHVLDDVGITRENAETLLPLYNTA
jgi:peroxiredoxin